MKDKIFTVVLAIFLLALLAAIAYTGVSIYAGSFDFTIWNDKAKSGWGSFVGVYIVVSIITFGILVSAFADEPTNK